jgi:wyosine [tRNA(Phe)-imidazoG37] synthetase (radical SAM superfamily)
MHINSSISNLKTTEHIQQLYDFKYIYAVLSRRSKGISIGINLNLDKRCNYRCVYCQVDRSDMPDNIETEIDIPLLQSELSQLLQAFQSYKIYDYPPFNTVPENQRILRDVAFSGDGESTAFRRFADCVDGVAETLSANGFKDTKIVLITNATYFHKKWMQKALESLDKCHSEIWAKLDAGTQNDLTRMNMTKFPLEKLIDNIALAGKNRPIIIQTLFAKMRDQLPSQVEIDNYIHTLQALIARHTQIKAVHLYTVARPPAQSYVSALDENTLATIAAQIRMKTNICVEVY